jgi:NTE family protein
MVSVAVACQGGGMHAAFEVGVLTEILADIDANNRFDLVGLSGTSAGALCTLLVWFGLAPKNSGIVLNASKILNDTWDEFVAQKGAETLLNQVTYDAFRAEEFETPLLGLSARVFGINPYRAGLKTLAAFLPGLGIRQEYFDLHAFLTRACPNFANDIDWPKVKTRLLVGASEVVNGYETVFDSDVNKGQAANPGMTNPNQSNYWRQRLPLSLEGVAASGTLPVFRAAENIGTSYYWDGLYSQNPPVREFFKVPNKKDIPDEIWIVRINPQQWPSVPDTNADIEDRENELMGNLSLNKELDFILKVNEWRTKYKNEQFAKDHKHVIVRTIKMTQNTADELQYSSKFDRSSAFTDRLRQEGRLVAKAWLANWPTNNYPQDAAWP